MISPLNPIGGLPFQLPPQINNMVQGLNIPTLPNLGSILPPFPLAPKAIPILPTQFQTNPFREMNLVDPFKTFDLATLTEEQLAVDDLGDILGKYLPSELIDEISNLADFGKYLLETGKSMVEVVMDLADKLSNFDLAGILRDLPIMDVINNIEGIISTAIEMGMSIVNFTQQAITNVFKFVAKVGNAINGVIYSAESFVMGKLSLLTSGFSKTINPIMSAGLIFGTVTSILSMPINLVNTLVSGGIKAMSPLLGVLSLSSSLNFNTLAGGLGALGVTRGMSLGNISPLFLGVNTINMLTTLTTSPARNIIGFISGLTHTYGYPLMNAYSTINSLFGHGTLDGTFTFLKSYGINQLSYIKNLYSHFTGFALNPIVRLFNHFTIDQLHTFHTDIINVGVANYLNNHASSEFSGIITLVQQYGVEIIDVGITAVQNNYQADIVVFDPINSVHFSNVIDVFTNVSEADRATLLQADLTHMGEALAIVNTYGSNLINATLPILTESLGLVSANQLAAILNAGSGFSGNTAANAFSTLASLSDAQKTLLSSKLSINEINTLFSEYSITGDVLNYLIKAITEEAAKQGNYKILVNLISNYPDILTKDYLMYLITTLLQNYVLTSDDNAMGVKLASINFVNALSIILPNWNYITINNKSIYNNTPLLTASMDSLTLLINNPSTATQAIIQKDSHFSLPQYLIN